MKEFQHNYVSIEDIMVYVMHSCIQIRQAMVTVKWVRR